MRRCNLETIIAVDLVILLLLIHGAPVLLRRLLGMRWAWPVDAGLVLADGRRLLGASKTWRGLLGAVAVAGLFGWITGLGSGRCALFGAAAMLGDLLSSFTKRRLGLESSAKATGIDQIPEALLPLLLGLWLWHYHWLVVPLGVAAFFVIEVGISPLLFRLGIRRRPY